MGIFNSLYSIGLAISLTSAPAVPATDAQLTKRDACDTGPGWASPVYTIGGGNPKYTTSCETQFGGDYSPLTVIEVWRAGDSIGGRIAGTELSSFILLYITTLLT